MPTFIDDFEDIEYFDSPAVRRVLREQERQMQRHKLHRSGSPTDDDDEDFDDDDYDDDFDDDDDYDDDDEDDEYSRYRDSDYD